MPGLHLLSNEQLLERFPDLYASWKRMEIEYASEGVVLDCPEDPRVLYLAPLGQYHCPVCGCMQLAGLPHIHEDVCWLGLEDLTYTLEGR